jgi:predicted nucleic acid-binding protein
MTTVVVDSSVAVKWVLPEHDTPLALSLYAEWRKLSYTQLAPDLFAYEVTNVIYRKALLGSITQVQAQDALKKLFADGPSLVAISGPDLSLRAMELSERFRRPASYDAHYLARAEREGCEFWTADERLVNSVKADLPWVRWLGEHAPAP